jgi:catechol 2,3-dioxygenase-like lactoylglutathione lyase family enzyme
VQLGESVVELLCPRQPDPARLGLEHVAFSVDDLDGTYEKMKAAGAAFSVPPKAAGSGVGRVAFFSDPDGIRVELLAQPRFNKPVSALRMNAHILDTYSVALRVADAARSRAFYERYLGAKPVKRFEVPARKMTLDYLACGRVVLLLVAVDGTEPLAEKRLQYLALRVDSVDRTVADFSRSGVGVADPPHDAAVGIGRVAVVLDPEGNRVELLDRPDARKL